MTGPVLVVGVGAIGGTTAGGLLRARRPVVLVDPWCENVEGIRRRGLALTVDGERNELPAQVLYPDELMRLEQRAQVVLLACKSYDTAAIVRAVEPYLAPDGVIVSLQNGINEDLIAQLIGPQRTIGCVVHYSAGMTETAHAVRYSLAGERSLRAGRGVRSRAAGERHRRERHRGHRDGDRKRALSRAPDARGLASPRHVHVPRGRGGRVLQALRRDRAGRQRPARRRLAARVPRDAPARRAGRARAGCACARRRAPRPGLAVDGRKRRGARRAARPRARRARAPP
jgi:ketopantoate reductase PanE/ApbA-like protein